MKKRATKAVGSFLLTAFIGVSVFGVFTAPEPKEAEALVSLGACIAAKVSAIATASPGIVSQAVTAIMVTNPAETIETAKGPAGTDWVQCFLRGLAITIGKTLLHTMTHSIVNWINRGFEGEPSFVTDLGGFMTDVADQTFGAAIDEISPLLCAPFQLDLRLALGIQAGLSGRDEIRCRLTDVLANIQGSYQQFVGGDFSAGGWNSFINIAGVPQNNAYGAYFASQNYIGARIVSATGREAKLLDFGDGFKSWRPCKVPGPMVQATDKNGHQIMQDDEVTPVMRKGPCREYGEIKTPGSVIVEQANASLRTTLEELNVAQDIDAVVGALINQLLVQVMTGVGGLAGVSRTDATSGRGRAVDSLGTDPSKVLASGT
ncbi:MAG: hypothetical protein Q7R88_00985, partial [bacterium]|nr:hypothetical protein [bacterium]